MTVAREREATMIDGHRYEMTMLGATAGYRLAHRLFRMFGPSFGSLMDATAGSKGLEQIDMSSKVVVNGLTTLTEQIHEKDLDNVIEQLRGQTHVGLLGSTETVPLGGVFEAHFSGDIAGLFKWIFWGLKVQFSTFSSVFASLTPPVVGDAAQAEKSPSP